MTGPISITRCDMDVIIVIDNFVKIANIFWYFLQFLVFIYLDIKWLRQGIVNRTLGIRRVNWPYTFIITNKKLSFTRSNSNFIIAIGNITIKISLRSEKYFFIGILFTIGNNKIFRPMVISGCYFNSVIFLMISWNNLGFLEIWLISSFVVNSTSKVSGFVFINI